jgi:DhnA family fructose-bisphosphate aldolase class Ia
MNPGKAIRLKRLIEPQYGSCIICALDHGMTSPNFLDGLYDTRKRTQECKSQH